MPGPRLAMLYMLQWHAHTPCSRKVSGLTPTAVYALATPESPIDACPCAVLHPKSSPYIAEKQHK
jgi:hypothetical protein